MSSIPSMETIEKGKAKVNAEKENLTLSHDSGNFDMLSYLSHYGIESNNKKNGNRGQALYILNHCLFNPDHNNGEAAITEETNGRLGYKCFHDSCSDKHWADVRVHISGTDNLAKFMNGYSEQNPKRSRQSAPNMADLREYIDFCIDPGQLFKVEEICRGMGAYTREHKKKIYGDLSRLAREGIIKKDKYRHGGFRRVLDALAYDLQGDIKVKSFDDIALPLQLEKILTLQPSQLIAISGRYDAGKSSFMYQTMAWNYKKHKIVHFTSPEWDLDAIKSRLDLLKVPRPHPNISVYPKEEGYEDLIPPEPCIVLIDYIRTQDSPYEIDREFHRILDNLHGGIVFAAIQKHPGIDRPTGGQFAIHAPQHVILLDKFRDKEAYICKILKTKSEENLEGLFKVFGFKKCCLFPWNKEWNKGKIKWDNYPKKEEKQENDSNDSKSDAVIKGGPHTYKDIKIKKEEKESSKEKEERNLSASQTEIISQEKDAHIEAEV